MKKIISSILVSIITISVLSAAVVTAADNTVFDGGDGTEAFPYLISTAEQLNQIRNYSNSYFLQTADIDMTSSYYYTVDSFSGGYDGGGHAIKGLRNCMFEENTGSVRNLGLIKANIQNSVRKQDGNHKIMNYSAVIAITNKGIISGCYSVGGSVVSDANLSATDATAMSYAGGLVQENDTSGVIENCYTRGTVRAHSYAQATGVTNTFASAYSYAGGIAANSSGTIKNCYSTAEVNASAYRSGYMGSQTAYKGVICGSNTGTIENSYYIESEACSEGTGYNSGDEPEKVTVEELKSYDMIRKLSPAFDYTWSMDLFDEALNEGYPILYAQSNELMRLNKSHKTGNHKEAFDLTLAAAFDTIYNVYYCVLGKDSGFKEYTSPIPITEKDTAVIAYIENKYNTDVRRTYKLEYHLADYPVSASVEEGTYHEMMSVELTSDEADAEIYYTTDGSDPRQEGSTRYIGAIPIYKNTTISAVAKVNGEFGDMLNYEYRISPIITPSVTAGSYSEPFYLSFTSSLKPYEIYYTTNGWGDPTKENNDSTKYNGDFEIYNTTLVKAAACYEGEWSEIQEFQYTFPQTEITSSVPAGEYEDVIKGLDFSCNLPYLDLYVAINGESGDKTTPIDIYKTATVNVRAKYKNNYITSEYFTYILPDVEITSNYQSGNYNNIINIELDCNIPSYELYYTIDGKDPAVNGILYSGPVELDDSANLKVAAKYGDAVAAEESFNYILNLEYVTANPPAGSYNDEIDVELTPSNPVYDIYYTTDGSSPKTNGIKYDAPIAITQSTVIKAAPRLGEAFGKTSSFEYIIGPEPPKGISADNYIIHKVTESYYTVSFDVISTLTDLKTADIYIALYDGDGVLLEVKKYIGEFSAGLNNTVRLPYTTNCRVQPDSYFKVMCWEKDMMSPIFKNGVVDASEIE